METMVYRKVEEHPWMRGAAPQQVYQQHSRPAWCGPRDGPLSLELFFPVVTRGGDGHLDALAPYMYGL